MFFLHAIFCHQLIVSILLLFSFINTQKVPSTANIEEYEDAMLDEIFAETNSKFPEGAIVAGGPSLPLPLPMAPSPAQDGQPFAPPPPNGTRQNAHRNAVGPTEAAANDGIDPNRKPAPGAVFSNPGFEPNQAPVGFDRPPSNGFSNAGRDNAMLFQGPLTDLVGQGAQNFYNGVRAAGRILGIDAGQYRPYEIPLLSQGARFFGRRK
ncbi:hypothetical protein niasHT_037519 [Heterodera trifolii]|uniref:Uncharacterized protein n=1 Tax=Heterodera trifolii TaxID=157864 RepID=A0ABD2IP40_9BILA